MQITKLKGSNKRSGNCRLEFNGDLTIYSAEETMQAILPYLSDYKEFELKLTAVGEIDTAGIQLLLLFDRQSSRFEQQTRCIEVSESVAEVLTIYRLNERFGVHTPNH